MPTSGCRLPSSAPLVMADADPAGIRQPTATTIPANSFLISILLSPGLPGENNSGSDGGEALMDVADHRRALADGGCGALRRARAHVARRVDAGGACLQQPGRAGVFAGEDEPVLVCGDGIPDPVGA